MNGKGGGYDRKLITEKRKVKSSKILVGAIQSEQV